MAKPDSITETAVEPAEGNPTGPGNAQKPSQDDVLLSWTVSLVRKDGLLKPLAAITVMAGVLALGAYLYRDALLVLFTGVVFFLATADYFFPMRFWLTREAAYRRTFYGTKFIRWSRVNRCYIEDKGIKLSPLTGPSRAEGSRGLFLYFGENRDGLVETVRDLASSDRG